MVSFIGAPSVKLAKYLGRILKSGIDTTVYNVKNSAEFVNYLHAKEITSGYAMLSFDVKSLFTNVPYDKVVERIQEKWKNIERGTKIPLQEFLKRLCMCMDGTYFSYDGNIYKQKYGTAMVSSISMVLADIIMNNIEEDFMKIYNQDVFFYKRYVDNSFAIVRQESVKDILQFLNNIHPRLQFACEEEKQNRLPFLDVVVPP